MQISAQLHHRTLKRNRTPCRAGLGLSVDDDEGTDGTSAVGAEPEFEITGHYEAVLKSNMEQLQWTALSMLLLSLSTCLLAVAQDLPVRWLSDPAHFQLSESACQDLVAFGVDLSEQVRTWRPFERACARVVPSPRC